MPQAESTAESSAASSDTAGFNAFMAKTRQHMETLGEEELAKLYEQWGTTAATLSGEAKAKRAKAEPKEQRATAGQEESRS